MTAKRGADHPVKAIVYDRPGAPDVLRLTTLPDPVPGPGDLLIRVRAISIEGGDLVGRRHLARAPGEVLGYAAAGDVVAVGPDVTGFAPGDRVASFSFAGSHAEMRVAPVATCWHVPDGLDLSVAATIPCAPGTAALALRLGHFQPGQTVLVTGAAGGVGVALVQLAAQAGARVIGTGTSAATLEALRDYGLTDAIVVGGEGAASQIARLPGAPEVDLLVDCVGGPALADGLDALRDGGTAILVGAFGAASAIDPMLLLRRRLTVTGCFLGPIMAEPEARAIVTDLLAAAAKGDLRMPIDAVYPLEQAAAAHARAEMRGRLGRVIITA